MNIEIFITIVVAILAARILRPLADMVTSVIFGSVRAASKSSGMAASSGSSKADS